MNEDVAVMIQSKGIPDMPELFSSVTDVAYTMEDNDVDPKKCFDIIVIFTIPSVIFKIYEMIQSCRKSKSEGYMTIQNLGLLGRWRLRGIIRAEIAKRNVVVSYSEIYDALNQYRFNITEARFNKIYDEVQNNSLDSLNF